MVMSVHRLGVLKVIAPENTNPSFTILVESQNQNPIKKQQKPKPLFLKDLILKSARNRSFFNQRIKTRSRNFIPTQEHTPLSPKPNSKNIE